MEKFLNGSSFYDFTDVQHIASFNNLLSQTQMYKDDISIIDEAIYGSDEFRMYAFKIKRCTRTRSHDWTACPYAHRGEKAQRRDPRKFHYSAIACPAFRSGSCRKGDSCEFAHGVFEYWLHPARYRTRACNAGQFCQRKVCFFAHTPEQLRSTEAKLSKCHSVYKATLDHVEGFVFGFGGGDEIGEVAKSAVPLPLPLPPQGEASIDGFEEFLQSLRGLKISDGWEELGEKNHCAIMEELDNSPHVDWISELVN